MRLRATKRVPVILGCFAGYLFIMLYIQQFVTVPQSLSFIKADRNLNVSYQFGFLWCMFGFIIGMSIYHGYQQGFGKKFFSGGSVFILLVVGLFACLHMAVPDVFSVAFYPLIILSAAYGSPGMNSFFGNKIMQRLGDWSFSIYLVHQPIAYTFFTLQFYLHPPKAGSFFVAQPKPGMLMAWLICLIFVALTLLLSWLKYKVVEVPARNWINNKFRTRDSKSNLQTL